MRGTCLIRNIAIKMALETIKTDEGKQKVMDLIDDYENKNLHLK